MAKGSAGKSGGMSRFRLVVMEAEIADGDVSQFAQAMQNALRGSAPIAVKRIASSPPIQNGAAHAEEPAVDETLDADEALDLNAAGAEPANDVPRPPRMRKPPKAPKAVPIDMHADMTLTAFAQGKDVGSQAKKYLVASAWLKEHRATDAVTDGHMYTCFKAMDWSTNIPNMAQPLRDLKAKNQYFEKTDKGYEINHLGLDFVKKLNGKA